MSGRRGLWPLALAVLLVVTALGNAAPALAHPPASAAPPAAPAAPPAASAAPAAAPASAPAAADPPGPLPPSPADPARPITDTALVADIAATATAQVPGEAPQLVTVEVLTRFEDHLSSAIEALGGQITGSVPGAIVQAEVPVDKVDDLALTAGVQYVQAPHTVVRPPDPQLEQVGYGQTVNEGVQAMRADAWHDAGLRGGGVKVGIVDFFVMSSWNTTEQGPLPTVANGHLLCRDTAGAGLCNADGSTNDAQGDIHGLAVTEIVKDTAPDADVYVATVATVSDLRTAIDWFADNGVTIITRSLGSAYDGPGDGTGPLDAVVDYAASRGLVWFNSAGNDAGTGYMKVTVASTDANGVVQFAPGDNLLRLTSTHNGCFAMDGIRWSDDWYKPPAQRTDYRVEVWQPTSAAVAGDVHTNPSPSNLMPVDLSPAPGVQYIVDASQTSGAPPLEMADMSWCTTTGISYLKVVRKLSTPIGSTPDVLEIASAFRDLEYDSDPAGSAAKPVVDSPSNSLVAVGALSWPTSWSVASYSSQGPTTDGRIKPDVVAPSCVSSVAYQTDATTCFAGTSASSPAAAGFAALLLSAGLATPGEPLAALVKHLTADMGTPGRDNATGAGKLLLPDPPSAPAPPQPAAYSPISPVRLLDTRTSSPVGPANLIGSQPLRGIIDLAVTGGNGVPAVGVSAVAVNITSVDSLVTHYIQALPTLQGTVGATSTLNVSVLGAPRPNFAIVPVGVDGQITLYMPTGGNVVVDLLGYFSSSSDAAAGRFVAITPERWMDTRPPGPYPVGMTTSRRLANGETVTLARLPSTVVPSTGVAALVINVTADDATGPGFVRVVPSGVAGLNNSTLNYLPGVPSANTSIVPLGADGTVSVWAYRSTHVIVDVMGYITSTDAPPTASGLFVALRPGRAYDSRSGEPFATGSTRVVQLAGLGGGAPAVPSSATAVSANLTADQAVAIGFAKVYPSGAPPPNTSNLNYAANAPVANAALLALGAASSVDVFVNWQTHVIIDVNGYFTGPS